MNLSNKIFKNKMIMEGEGYFFLSVEDVKEFIQDLKNRFRSHPHNYDKYCIDAVIDEEAGGKLI